MDEICCPYTIKRKIDSKTLLINCRNCTQGNSTIFDEICRSNIFKLLQKEHRLTKITLNHALVKVFVGKELEVLQELARLIETLESHSQQKVPAKTKSNCIQCVTNFQQELKNLLDLSKSDPVLAYLTLENLSKNAFNNAKECLQCKYKPKLRYSAILKKTGCSRYINVEENKESNYYYAGIRPYVRPGFIDSYIQLEPPSDAVFLESYKVEKKNHRPLNVSLYMLRTRPEKLYFVVPSEYNLPSEELMLLENVHQHLSTHRPKDATFMDAETAREYFQKFGKHIISQLVNEQQLDLDTERIEYLADVFSRYTAGFGILEDLLLDHRIQDIYVNAPVSNNPLHIVLEGEEYTSNIFLSHGDIDALSSRFRTLSGRAFSEASPVLDMDLAYYRTRVAAISNPLTPRGVAFALRRHRQKPWTLAHFIANKMLSAEAAGFLSFLIDGQASLLIAGSRGAGKTSLLSALLLEIPQRFRILTLEDTAEIPVDQFQHLGYKLQSLITKSMSSSSSSTEVEPKDALRTALRLGESVLILGEVRGVEAKVLFEAMRIGAAGNLIMGTIHGSTTRDVYERVVYDIGIPATSFKAVEGVIIVAPIRTEGGIERNRRVTQISETSKTAWSLNPDPDKIFQDIMAFDTQKDQLVSTTLLDMGQSQLIQRISRSWGITVEKALQNIKLRAEIKSTIVKYSKKNQNLLEAPAIRDANNAFWMLIEDSKHHDTSVNYLKVRKKWMKWFEYYAGRSS
jgi:type IV secretory pathway ATPase VirB11/archaellum biosynthesis ATPase